MIIGITGGTGSGKTSLLKLLEAHGFTVLDCDAIYHMLLQTDKNMLSAIADRFPGVVTDSTLDRKKLGSIVFADPAALQALNHITHRAVKKEVLRQIEGTDGKVAIDAIGLFEGGLAQLCDITVAVTAPEDMRIQRLMARDNIPEEYARSRIAAQRTPEEFQALCDYTLKNDSTEAVFREKCLAFFQDRGIINL